MTFFFLPTVTLLLPLAALAAALGDGPALVWTRHVLYAIGHGAIKILRLLAIGFAVIMSVSAVVLGCVFVVAPYFIIRALVHSICFVASKFWTALGFIYNYFPVTKLAPPISLESGMMQPLLGVWAHYSLYSVKATSDLDLNAEPTSDSELEPPVNRKKERKLKKKRRQIKMIISDWAAQVAAEKERRRREVAAAGHDSDGETAVIGRVIITTRMRRATF